MQRIIEYIILGINIVCAVVTVFSLIKTRTMIFKIKKNFELDDIIKINDLIEKMSLEDEKLRKLTKPVKRGTSCFRLIIEHITNLENLMLDICKVSTINKKMASVIKKSKNVFLKKCKNIKNFYKTDPLVDSFQIDEDYNVIFNTIIDMKTVGYKLEVQLREKTCNYSLK